MASPEGSVPPGRFPAFAPGMRRLALALLSVLTTVPVLWLGTSHAERTAASDREVHEQMLSSATHAVARQLDLLLESRCHDLEVLAGHLEPLGELTGPRVQALLDEHLARSGYYTRTSVGDAAGTPLTRSRATGARAEVDAPSSDGGGALVRDLARTRRTAISRVEGERTSQAVNVRIASPIFAPDRSLAGYVEGALELDGFAALVRRAAASVPAARVVVFDGTGRVVADSTEAAQAGSESLAAAPLFALTASSAIEAGGARLANWRVVASESEARIDENARRTKRQTLATAFGVWLVIFLAAGALADRHGRKLAELASTVSAIGAGDFDRRPAPPEAWEPREFGVLRAQIDAMATRLSHQTRELETRVTARTAELAQVNERLTILVDALERADDGIEITGPDARFVYVNPAFQRITGYSASELIGNTPAMLRSSAHDAAFYDAIWERVSSGQVYSGLLVGRRKDGAHFDQELTVWPIVERTGAITHYVGLRRDVTDRQRTERALRVSERMASVGTLAAGVAHEINNPLTYVLLNLNYLRDHVLAATFDSEAQAERFRLAADRALEGADRVHAIVRDLRTLSRPDDRTVKRIDPAALLESALRMVGSDIRHRAHLVEAIASVPAVLGNEAQLSQVFLNLLVNAVQAFAERPARPPEIRVKAETDERGFAVVEVSDNGTGIAPEHLHRIFDPFFTTKPVGLGTGIGLAVCHGTVKAMQGEIQVESTLGVGSRFRVRLPPAPAVESAPSQAPVSDAVRRSVPPQRLLVMDDDRAVAEALSEGLGRHAVTVVGSAAEGLEAVERSSFTAIFCDVMMPDATGIDFYEELARRAPAELARVVFMTGGVLTEAAREFLERNAVTCLEKPISVEQLEAVVARLAETPARRANRAGPAA